MGPTGYTSYWGQNNRAVAVLRVALDTNCWIDAVRSGSQAFGALQRILKARQVGEATLVDGVYQSVTDPRRLVVLRRTELRTEACSPIVPGNGPVNAGRCHRVSKFPRAGRVTTPALP